MATHIVIVNFKQGVAYADDGAILPILSWFDDDGRRTTDWSEAVSFVASTENLLFIGKTADWVRATIH